MYSGISANQGALGSWQLVVARQFDTKAGDGEMMVEEEESMKNPPLRKGKRILLHFIKQARTPLYVPSRPWSIIVHDDASDSDDFQRRRDTAKGIAANRTQGRETGFKSLNDVPFPPAIPS